MEQVEQLFETKPHPNPFNKLISDNIAILLGIEPLYDGSGFTEIPARNFFAKAIEYLGTNIVSIMISLMQIHLQSSTVTAMGIDGSMRHILEAMVIGKVALTVSVFD